VSFRLKIVVGIAAIEVTMLAILIVSGLYYLRSSNESQLLERARATASLFATMTGDAVLSLDLATLNSLVARTLRDPGILYVRVRDRKGVVLAEGGDRMGLEAPFAEDRTLATAIPDQRLDISHPIVAAGEPFGKVEIGISTSVIGSVLKEASNWMLAIAALEIAIVGVFGLLLGSILTRQLAYLRAGASKVAAGEFGYQLAVRGDDELADTTRNFNQMSLALADFAEKALHAQRLAEEGKAYAEIVLHDAMNSMPQAVLIVDGDERVAFANGAFNTDYPEVASIIPERPYFAAVAKGTAQYFAGDGAGDEPPRADERLMRLRKAERFRNWETRRRDGRAIMNMQRRMSNGGVVVVETDVTELYDAHERNRQLEMELMESQKRESLGTLAGGIAHEINTPVQYIGNNIRFLSDAFADIIAGIDDCLAALPKDDAVARAKLTRMDWTYLAAEIPSALSEAAEGVETVSRIVLSMKEVSFPQSDEKTPYDLRKLVENALTVSRNQWKYCAEVECAFDDGIPHVPCFPGEMSQVLINLLVNAAHAVEEKVGEGGHGLIRVSLSYDGQKVRLQVSDNGIGIAPEHQDRIFDMFFTTKGPGKGTGQGLAICRSIVEKKHGGRLTVRSEQGVGTTFAIELPAGAEQRLAS
jgi:signal transduction histidine kinase